MASMPDESNLLSVGGGGARHMARRIRDGLSVLCIIACVALLIAWVRSYRMADRLHGRFWGRQSFVIASKQGCMMFVVHRWDGNPEVWRWQVITHGAADIAQSFPIGSVRAYEAGWGFGRIQRPLMAEPFEPTSPRHKVNVEFVDGLDVIVLRGPGPIPTLNGSGVIVPYWFLAFLVGGSAFALQTYRPWRYSLRGLLAAVTFVAILLSLIAVLDRPPIREKVDSAEPWTLDIPTPLDDI
ncbi:MAG TPA: hypothetical protein VHK01_00300 [Lacipirellulaceae bacterium]|jgi:hypothetical protein|nr:hypothetical protein [Lacipirellulaceae bacterium]